VWENRWAHSTLFDPNAEMKLYPPVIPGYSTLSLHHGGPSAQSPTPYSQRFLASPYNTLRAISPSSPSTAMMFARVEAASGNRSRGASWNDLTGAAMGMGGDLEGMVIGGGSGGAGMGSRRQSSTSLRRARSAGVSNTGGAGLRRSSSNRSQ